jgi:hypothetical protein
MKKKYIAPVMEEFKMESVNPIAASGDPKYGGPGSGSGDAPFMQDFEDFDQFNNQFQDFKLW